MLNRNKKPPHLFSLNDPAVKYAQHVADQTRKAHFLVRNALGGLDAVECDRYPATTGVDDRTPVAIVHPTELPAGHEDKTKRVRTYQGAVCRWVRSCFSAAVAKDVRERACRFLEEAVELAQSCELTREDAHTLIDYTFDRPVGQREQEVGGTMVTLAALCSALRINMRREGWVELKRISDPEVIKKIQAKQATKVHSSPLPGATLADVAEAFVRAARGPVRQQYDNVCNFGGLKAAPGSAGEMLAQVFQAELPDMDSKRPISWLSRFSEAMTLLTGREPPLEMLRDWAAEESEYLQDWVGTAGGPWWCQNIAIIEAAMTMADCPIEGRPEAIDYITPAEMHPYASR
jgi:hypothetical protein